MEALYYAWQRSPFSLTSWISLQEHTRGIRQCYVRETALRAYTDTVNIKLIGRFLWHAIIVGNKCLNKIVHTLYKCISIGWHKLQPPVKGLKEGESNLDHFGRDRYYLDFYYRGHFIFTEQIPKPLCHHGWTTYFFTWESSVLGLKFNVPLTEGPLLNKVTALRSHKANHQKRKWTPFSLIIHDTE